MQQQIWGEVVDFNLAFFQFIWECNSENIIKIRPYLPKLWQEKFGAVFFGPPCIIITLLQIVYTVYQWNKIENRPIIGENIDRS